MVSHQVFTISAGFAKQTLIMTSAKPITETANLLSADIDLLSSHEILRVLKQVDSQIFYGWKHYPGVCDDVIIERLTLFTHALYETLSDPGGVVVLGGCGTSGRLAMLTSTNFNTVLKQHGKESQVKYLIAGGSEAVTKARELAEDDPCAGIKELDEAAQQASQVLYVGISCGLSAPYVAGQLFHSISRYHTVVIGFNPVDLARTTHLEAINCSFKDVVTNMEVGPETIAGSSRMKGGSATKVILDMCFSLAISSLVLPEKPLITRSAVRSALELYARTHWHCYEALGTGSAAATLVANASAAIRNRGHIYYLIEGDAGMGVMALIDASECVPTFGADPMDVQAFSSPLPAGGSASWTELTLNRFQTEILPTINNNDCLICCTCSTASMTHLLSIAQQASSTGAKLSLVVISTENDLAVLPSALTAAIPTTLPIPLPTLCLSHQGPRSLAELAFKWTLNAISTGAYVLNGKVYENIMIDVVISNSKLLQRATAIVSQVACVSTERARQGLLTVIAHQHNTPLSQLSQSSDSDIIKLAIKCKRVVLLATLLSAGVYQDVNEAAAALQQTPVLRNLLKTINKAVK